MSTPSLSHLNKLAEIGNSFVGVDLSYRRFGHNWPKSWRVRIVSNKFKFDDVFGDTAEEAIDALEVLLQRIK